MEFYFDDNNRKPTCRLYFDGKKYHIGIFDENKNEERYVTSDVNDIFQHAQTIKDTIAHYKNKD